MRDYAILSLSMEIFATYIFHIKYEPNFALYTLILY